MSGNWQSKNSVLDFPNIAFKRPSTLVQDERRIRWPVVVEFTLPPCTMPLYVVPSCIVVQCIGFVGCSESALCLDTGGLFCMTTKTKLATEALRGNRELPMPLAL